MNLNSIKKRVETIATSEKRWPIVVDLSNRSDLADFIEYFSVGDNIILAAEKFCGKDGTFKLEELINTIENNHGVTFVVGLTAFLKLQGESYTKSTLKTLLSKSVGGHLFLVTYQCKNLLKFADSRFVERNQILIADGDTDDTPDICFINPDLRDVITQAYDGFDKIGKAMECIAGNTIYIVTEVTKRHFDKSIYNISQMNNGYDILCEKDSRTKMLPSDFGSAEQWNKVLKEIGDGNWITVVETHFGHISNLADSIGHYSEFDDYSKWLYFAALSLFGCKNNEYLQYATHNSANYSELIRSLYRTLLTVQYTEPRFDKLYAERKEILKYFINDLNDIVAFCKVISVKDKSAIYYLTDLTQPEKEKIIEWLDTYGSGYTASELTSILSTVYPDLADYLSVYRFKNTLLDNYFEDYKYQKIINKILPSFETFVDEQSHELGFVDALKSRTKIVDSLNFNNAHAFFVDALGVEYLGYIQSKCQQYGLLPLISVVKCELPSLTCYNKEFMATFSSNGCPVSDIKTLDEIKHHGEDNFDYEKDKKPVYLLRELEVIDELLKKIRAGINSGQYEKAIVISDHGASRLAVLHETENLWRMATNGVHSGRCCPQNEVDSKPDSAIEAEGYWVLTNYDRFQGSRRANVEVHGGATLEEVTVPIIEIIKKLNNIEAFITDESKIITLAAKEHPIIKIFVGTVSNNISIKINGKYYDANKTEDDYLYVIELPEFTKKGKYLFDIMNGTEMLALEQTFEIRKKGISETSLFD